MSPSPVDRLEYRPGSVIPGTQYRVIRRIGAGGMGLVYEVEDTTIEKRYVVKTIQAKLATRDDIVERFVREAKTLAKLEHKNIVQIFTAGVTDDVLRLRYFVMEKLNGHSLRTVLDTKTSLEPDASCRLMLELLNALDRAHEQGIIHRDIKPENIFIHRNADGTSTLKLIDFGIMTSADAKTIDRRAFVGTARYAAPEQIDNRDVTPQTDLYAASLVLYECLAGRGPFDDIVDLQALMNAHRSTPAPAITRYKPHVPAPLERLVLRGLAKDPGERPLDAFTYAAELSRIRKMIKEGAARAATGRASQHPTAADVLPASLVGAASPSEGALAGAATTDSETEKLARPPFVTPAGLGPTAMTPRGADAATALDAPNRGATTPAGSDAPTPKLAGGTVLDGEPPEMSLGPEPLPAAMAARADGYAQGGIDRSAPTATSIPFDPEAGIDPAQRTDTVRMDVVEQQNLAPVVPGAVAQKTTRMTPSPEAFTSSPGYTTTSPGTGGGGRNLATTAASQRHRTRTALVAVAAGAVAVVLVAALGIALAHRAHARDEATRAAAAAAAVTATAANGANGANGASSANAANGVNAPSGANAASGANAVNTGGGVVVTGGATAASAAPMPSSNETTAAAASAATSEGAPSAEPTSVTTAAEPTVSPPPRATHATTAPTAVSPPPPHRVRKLPGSGL